jgi:hypothetical protein
MEHDVSLARYYTHVLTDVVIVAIAALVVVTVFLPVTAVTAVAKKRSGRWFHQRSNRGPAELVR